ncbi:hypothetical protein Tco_0245472 [Tanacetum coccineum]
MTVGEVNTRVTELAELHERDTQDLYALLEDAQDSRSRISQRVDMNSQSSRFTYGDRMTPSGDSMDGTPDTATAAEYSHSDTAPVKGKKKKSRTDGRDALKIIRDMRREMSDIGLSCQATARAEERLGHSGPRG